MKKMISAFLILLIVLSLFGVTVFASEKVVESALNIKETVSTEQKILCKATTNDDFEDDSVIVVINNSKSKELKKYTENDFSEVSPVSTKNLTARTENRVELQRGCEDSSVRRSIISISTEDEMYVDENKFHQIIKLDLGTKSKQNVLKCVKMLEQRDDVLMVFPNYIYKSAASANDTLYSEQWAIDQISLPQAWNITTGSSSVKVGVIDSGIDGTHPDLINRVNTELSMDFTGGNSPLTDEGGHGTTVAGVIGAQGNNSTGVTGTCWNVSLVSLKAAVKSGDHCVISFERLVNAVEYAQEKKIPIINYSYGGNYDDAEFKIALGNYSGLFVCSAGNQVQDITNSETYPINYGYDNVIAVAGTNSNDVLYSYYDYEGDLTGSNYSATKVHLAAPGQSIYTTSASEDYDYTLTSGTSIAAPYVTGVAALLKSKYPGMDAKAIKDYILSNVDSGTDLETDNALNGKVATNGRLNAYKALTNLKYFTVIYEPNGGSAPAAMGVSTIIYGCTTPLSTNTYSKFGYTFKGWHVQKTDTGEWLYTNGSRNKWFVEGNEEENYYKYTYRDGQKVARTAENGKTVKMYAQWEKQFKIQFVGNNATSGSAPEMTITSGSPMSLPSNAFTRTGCTLDHWYAKNSEGNHYFSNGTSKGWYPLLDKPTGYTRIDYIPGSIVSAEDIDGVEYDETVYLYAYWRPNSGILGDADMSGSVEVKDATHIQKYVAGLVSLSSDQLILADVDFSGDVDTPDATAIQKYVAGQMDEFGL